MRGGCGDVEEEDMERDGYGEMEEGKAEGEG